jgi:hypothetical protein
MLVEEPSGGGAAAAREAEVSGKATDEAIGRRSAWPEDELEGDGADSDRVFCLRRRSGIRCVYGVSSRPTKMQV